MSGLGSFLGGLAQGGMGAVQMKGLSNQMDTAKAAKATKVVDGSAPLGTQAVQATAQANADQTSGVGLAVQPTQPQQPQQAAQPTAAPQGGASLWQNLMNFVNKG